MKFFYINIIFLFLSFIIYSQPDKINFNKITNIDGLSQNSGRDIIQDSRGFIWIATELGLNRFDGYNFKIYDQSSDLKHNLSNIYVNKIIEDSKGNIVIGSDGGVDYLNFKTGIIDHYLYKLENPENIYVWDIIEDSNNNLWIASSKGLYKLEPENEKITLKKYNIEVKYTGIANIIELNPNVLLLGLYDRLLKFNIKTGKFSEIKNSPKGINYIFKNSDSTIYVFSLFDEPKIYNPKKNIFIKHDFFISELKKYTNNVQDIVKDKENNLWIATYDSGLIYFDKKNAKFKLYKSNSDFPGSISSNKLHCVYIDEAGVLWAGTLFDGVNYYDTKTKAFNHYFADKKGHKIGGGNGIVKSGHNIWLGTYKGALKYNLKDYSSTLYSYDKKQNSISGNMVTDITKDNDGIIWFGTDDNGLSSYNPKTEKFKNYFSSSDSNSLSGSSVWALDTDNNDNIWIGYWHDGVDCYNKNTKTVKNYSHNPHKSNTLTANNINTIKVAPDGKIWIGTWEGGINILNPQTGKFSYLKHKADDTNSIPQNNVMVTVFDSYNNVWIGTFSAGLCKYNPKNNSFKRYSTADGLPANTIQGIIEDNKKRLWISTSNGLCKFNPKTNKFKVYDIEDGIQAKEFSQSGYYKTEKGNLLFSGSNGFNYFNPDSIIDNKYSPPIQIVDFKISNKKVKIDSTILSKHITLTDKIILKYKQRDFSLKVVSLHYPNPDKILYAYKLEGYDKKWKTVDANNRKIAYTNLNPGNYTLKIKATNCDRVWSKNIKTLDIEIIPPFYKTKLFYAIIIILIVSLIYFIIRFREYKIKKDKERLEIEVKKRTLEIEQQKEEIISQNEELQIQKEEISRQRDIANTQKQEILASIKYAQKIQKAIVPSQKLRNKILPHNFLLFRPRDIVSGDFYWLKKIKNLTIVAVADCTGHGVPGAFMSMLGYSFLNEIVTKFSLDKPGEILNRLRKKVKNALHQFGEIDEPKDGMDLAFYIFNTDNFNLSYAGAYNPLWIVRDRKMFELKANRQPIGAHFIEEDFITKKIQLQKNDCLYTFSDGFPDQFGGKERKKYMIKKLKKFIVFISNKNMNEQKKLLIEELENWMGDNEQVDDIILLGHRV